MPSISEFERLFLLEFFVDSVYVKNSSVEDVNSTLCVSFQFLYYPVMLVCEEDFSPKTKSLSKGTDVIFKSGKSCLFSLRTDQGNSMPSDFDLTIKVIQNMKKSNPIERSIVGEAIVKLGGSFTNLMKNSNSSTVPAAVVKQDTFPLKDKTGQHVGNLAAFVRLSCFGKLIVTQFQLAGEDSKNYMFKGTDPKKIFTDDEDVIKAVISEERYELKEAEEEIPGDTPYKDIFGFPKESEESMKTKGEEGGEGDQEGAEEAKAMQQSEKKHEEEQKEAEISEKEEAYKEIGAEINGNCITIRVLKKAKRNKKQIGKSSDEVSQNQPSAMHPMEGPMPMVCTCQLMPRYPSPPPPPPQPKTCQQGCPPTCCPPVECPTGCFSPPPSCPPKCCPPVECPAGCCAPPPSCSPKCCPPPPVCPGCPPSPAFSPNYLPPLSNYPYSAPGINQQQMYYQGQNQNIQQCPKEDCPLGLYNPNPNPNPKQNIMDLEPGTVAMKGDQVIFQMANRPVGEPITERERKLAESIHYKIASSEAGKEGVKNTVHISPQNPGEPFNTGVCPGGGPVSGLPIDNKQDMFLLKVQQNSDAVEAKSKLEMELRTPKTKEPKPDTSTKNTQCITTDFPAPEKKPGPEKGKKKKK